MRIRNSSVRSWIGAILLFSAWLACYAHPDGRAFSVPGHLREAEEASLFDYKQSDRAGGLGRETAEVAEYITKKQIDENAARQKRHASHKSASKTITPLPDKSSTKAATTPSPVTPSPSVPLAAPCSAQTSSAAPKHKKPAGPKSVMTQHIGDAVMELQNLLNQFKTTCSNLRDNLSVGPAVANGGCTSCQTASIMQSAPALIQTLMENPDQIVHIPDILQSSVPTAQIADSVENLREALRRIFGMMQDNDSEDCQEEDESGEHRSKKKKYQRINEHLDGWKSKRSRKNRKHHSGRESHDCDRQSSKKNPNTVILSIPPALAADLVPAYPASIVTDTDSLSQTHAPTPTHSDGNPPPILNFNSQFPQLSPISQLSVQTQPPIHPQPLPWPQPQYVSHPQPLPSLELSLSQQQSTEQQRPSISSHQQFLPQPQPLLQLQQQSLPSLQSQSVAQQQPFSILQSVPQPKPLTQQQQFTTSQSQISVPPSSQPHLLLTSQSQSLPQQQQFPAPQPHFSADPQSALQAPAILKLQPLAASQPQLLTRQQPFTVLQPQPLFFSESQSLPQQQLLSEPQVLIPSITLSLPSTHKSAGCSCKLCQSNQETNSDNPNNRPHQFASKNNFHSQFFPDDTQEILSESQALIPSITVSIPNTYKSSGCPCKSCQSNQEAHSDIHNKHPCQFASKNNVNSQFTSGDTQQNDAVTLAPETISALMQSIFRTSKPHSRKTLTRPISFESSLQNGPVLPTHTVNPTLFRQYNSDFSLAQLHPQPSLTLYDSSLTLPSPLSSLAQTLSYTSLLPPRFTPQPASQNQPSPPSPTLSISISPQLQQTPTTTQYQLSPSAPSIMQPQHQSLPSNVAAMIHSSNTQATAQPLTSVPLASFSNQQINAQALPQPFIPATQQISNPTSQRFNSQVASQPLSQASATQPCSCQASTQAPHPATPHPCPHASSPSLKDHLLDKAKSKFCKVRRRRDISLSLLKAPATQPCICQAQAQGPVAQPCSCRTSTQPLFQPPPPLTPPTGQKFSLKNQPSTKRKSKFGRSRHGRHKTKRSHGADCQSYEQEPDGTKDSNGLQILQINVPLASQFETNNARLSTPPSLSPSTLPSDLTSNLPDAYSLYASQSDVSFHPSPEHNGPLFSQSGFSVVPSSNIISPTNILNALQQSTNSVFETRVLHPHVVSQNIFPPYASNSNLQQNQNPFAPVENAQFANVNNLPSLFVNPAISSPIQESSNQFGSTSSATDAAAIEVCTHINFNSDNGELSSQLNKPSLQNIGSEVSSSTPNSPITRPIDQGLGPLHSIQTQPQSTGVSDSNTFSSIQASYSSNNANPNSNIGQPVDGSTQNVSPLHNSQHQIPYPSNYVSPLPINDPSVNMQSHFGDLSSSTGPVPSSPANLPTSPFNQGQNTIHNHQAQHPSPLPSNNANPIQHPTPPPSNNANRMPSHQAQIQELGYFEPHHGHSEPHHGHSTVGMIAEAISHIPMLSHDSQYRELPLTSAIEAISPMVNRNSKNPARSTNSGHAVSPASGSSNHESLRNHIEGTAANLVEAISDGTLLLTPSIPNNESPVKRLENAAGVIVDHLLDLTSPSFSVRPSNSRTPVTHSTHATTTSTILRQPENPSPREEPQHPFDVIADSISAATSLLNSRVQLRQQNRVNNQQTSLDIESPLKLMSSATSAFANSVNSAPQVHTSQIGRNNNFLSALTNPLRNIESPASPISDSASSMWNSVAALANTLSSGVSQLALQNQQHVQNRLPNLSVPFRALQTSSNVAVFRPSSHSNHQSGPHIHLSLPRDQVCGAVNGGTVVPGDIVTMALNDQSTLVGKVVDSVSPISFTLIKNNNHEPAHTSNNQPWNIPDCGCNDKNVQSSLQTIRQNC